MIRIIFILNIVNYNYRGCDYGFKRGEAWIAVYDSVFIMYTEDGGLNWLYINPGTQRGLFDIFFIDSLRGWTGGRLGEIRHTQDGGLTWSLQWIGYTKWVARIQFLDQLHGYGAAGDYTVFVTSNGGQTWNIVFTQFMGVDFYGIHFISPQIGFICSGLPTEFGTPGYVAKSVDGGFTWNTLLEANGFDLFDIWFFNEQKGIVVGGNDSDTISPVILKTEDGGFTWTQIIPPGYYLRAVHFVSENKGWACGRFGTIIKTEDGGNTWVLQNVGGEHTLFDIDFLDSLHGVASGEDAIFFTNDGGNTWINVNVNEVEKVNKRKIYFSTFPHRKNLKGFKEKVLDITGKENSLKNLKSGIYFMNSDERKFKFIILK
ncbi:MAG: hypothetical protein ABDH37_06130 [Candidatus Hydrothermales bacterium]